LALGDERTRPIVIAVEQLIAEREEQLLNADDSRSSANMQGHAAPQ
jgi:hypothetical protein